jgi:hypothetical protein
VSPGWAEGFAETDAWRTLLWKLAESSKCARIGLDHTEALATVGLRRGKSQTQRETERKRIIVEIAGNVGIVGEVEGVQEVMSAVGTVRPPSSAAQNFSYEGTNAYAVSPGVTSV